MSKRNLPGNIFVGATLVGRHEGGLAGTVYDASDQKAGAYAAGSVLPPSPAMNSGIYKDGFIYDYTYGKVGSYKDGRILNNDGKEVGKYTGGDEGGAAGAFLLVF